MQFSHSNARLRRDFLATQIHSSGLLTPDSHHPCPGVSSTLSTAVSQRLSSYNLVIKPKDMRIVTLLTGVAHCSTPAATHFSALARAGYTRASSDVLDDFLLRLRGVSLWPCPGCADSQCASCAPPDRLLLDRLVLLRFTRSLVLSVGNVTSFTASCVRIILRSPGLSSPPKATSPEIVHSGSLRLMSCRPRPA